jgi:hypothetical protein
VPDIIVGHVETPETSTKLGAKGIGEAGLIGAMGGLGRGQPLDANFLLHDHEDLYIRLFLCPLQKSFKRYAMERLGPRIFSVFLLMVPRSIAMVRAHLKDGLRIRTVSGDVGFGKAPQHLSILIDSLQRLRALTKCRQVAAIREISGISLGPGALEPPTRPL